MELEKIKLNQIKVSEYNPRQISSDEQKRLSKNLKEFGLVDPIIINLKNNKIIGGHQRYHVLSKNNKKAEFNLIRLGDIGWVFDNEELTIEDEAHEKALNLALNKISGEWDYNKLTPLLNNLQNQNFDMDLTGFDDIELSAFNIEENIFLDESIFEAEKEYDVEETVPEAETSQEDISDNSSPSEDEVLVNESEVKHFKCPKCGHEW